MHDMFMLSTKPSKVAPGVELKICSIKAIIASHKYSIGPLSLLVVVVRGCGAASNMTIK